MSTALKVCHNRRIHSHRTFRGVAQRGKTSMGWFYGFKRHRIVDHRGDRVSVMLTAGNVDDRNLSLMQQLTTRVLGKRFGDRGYISGKLFKTLFQRGLHRVTRIKKNRDNKLMPIMDRLLLEKRAIIESIIDPLKNLCQIEHTRRRSPVNFLGNLFSGLIAYTFVPQKPSITADSHVPLNFCALGLCRTHVKGRQDRRTVVGGVRAQDVRLNNRRRSMDELPKTTTGKIKWPLVVKWIAEQEE